MKHWQEKRNYQHVRDEAGNVRSNIITVDGNDVEVSDEVYLAYTQLDRRERYLMEEVETDKKLSLDRLLKWQMIQALYWEGVSAREYARRLGVYHRTVLYWRDKILEKLRQKF